MIRKKTAAYALLALFEIADQHRGVETPTGVRAHDIAEKHDLPKAYVAKILSQLAAAEILHSDRGPKGGFRLNRQPDDITLYDIFDAAGAITINDKRSRNQLKGMPQPIQTMLGNSQEEAAQSMRKILQSSSLGDLFKKKK